jgi:hypothetical protein
MGRWKWGPPGIITMDMVRAINALGYVIGSGSDRPLSSQRHLWESPHIVVDFMALKHQLAEVKAQFQAEAYDHIDDTDMDRFLAERAGCRFVMADAAVRQAWGPEVFPEPPKAWLAGLTRGSAMFTAKLA